MKFTIITLSQSKLKSLTQMISEYEKRIQGYAQIHIMNLSPKKAKHVDIEVLRSEDESRILSALPKQTQVFLCDEQGKSYTSQDFSTLLETSFLSNPEVTFVIGPAYGLSRSLLQKYPTLAFSKMTFQHEIAKLVLIEQIYRALTLMHNHPYHF